MAVVDATPTTFRDSVFAALDTFWADRTPISWPNKKFDPPELGLDKADAWIRVDLIGSADGEENRGSGIFQRGGTLTLQVYVRAQTSTDLLYQLVNAGMEFCERAAGASVKDGFLRSARYVEIGPDGVWFQANVVCDYVYFTERALQ